MIRVALEIDKNIEKLSTKELMDRYETEIRNNKKFQGEETEIIRKSESTIRVITEEGYVFDVTMNGVEYKGIQGESQLPDLVDGDIKFILEPSEWTNGAVEVQIETKEGYIIEYTEDGKEWEKYEGAIRIENNTQITARGVTTLDEIKGYAVLDIENIDRLSPKIFSVNVQESTTNSITVKGETDDQEKTETDGKSGVKEYYFSKDNGTTWVSNENKLETTYNFTNLTQGQKYTIKMKAIDNAGNEVITEAIEQVTGEVPGGTASISFGYNPSGWTNGNVTVSITNKESGYNLEYSTDGSKWTPYTTGIVMSTNGAIYARLKDSTGQIGAVATGNVTKIDKLAPNNFTPTATSGTNTITLTGSTSDAAATSTNGSSGVAKYYFSKDNGATWLPSNGQTSNSYTFTGLTNNTNYTLKMKVVDNAGNPVTTGSITQKTLLGIARIGSNDYTSIQAAIDAVPANTKTVVTVLQNSTEDVWIDSSKNVQLELTGKTLNGKITSQGTVTVNGGTINTSEFAIETEGANFTLNSVVVKGQLLVTGGNAIVNGGSITTTNTNTIINWANLTIQGNPTITCTASFATIYNEPDSTVTFVNGTVTGTVYSPVVKNYGIFYMRGGTIKGARTCFHNYSGATFNMSAGTMKSDSTQYYVAYNEDGATATCTGGTATPRNF